MVVAEPVGCLSDGGDGIDPGLGFPGLEEAGIESCDRRDQADADLMQC